MILLIKLPPAGFEMIKYQMVVTKKMILPEALKKVSRLLGSAQYVLIIIRFNE